MSWINVFMAFLGGVFVAMGCYFLTHSIVVAVCVGVGIFFSTLAIAFVHNERLDDARSHYEELVRDLEKEKKN